MKACGEQGFIYNPPAEGEHGGSESLGRDSAESSAEQGKEGRSRAGCSLQPTAEFAQAVWADSSKGEAADTTKGQGG